MNKGKIMLAAICLLAAAGGALAYKAAPTPGFIRQGGAWVPQTIDVDCPELGLGCYYYSGVVPNITTFTFYTKDGLNYRAVKP